MPKKNSTFCIRPFVSAVVNETGDIKPCCVIKKKHSTYQGEKYFNLKTSNVKEYWKSDYLKELQQALLNDQKPSECSVCWHNESNSAVSHRTIGNKEYKFLAKSNYEKYLKILNLYELDEPIEYEIAITNLCNLKCAMCSGVHSAKLLIENKAIGIEKQLDQKDFDWSDKTKKEFVESINSKTVKKLILLGGESLIVPDIIQILKNISETSYADEVEVNIITNGTIFNKKIETILQKIKKLKIIFSIESTSLCNNYLRYPSDWNQISKNVKSFQKLKDAYFYISCVVQNLNILYIDQIIKFAHDHNMHIRLMRLQEPNYLDLENLPQHLLKLAYEKLDRVPQEQRVHCTNFDGILNILKEAQNKKLNPDKFKEFKKMIILRDNFRKISINEYMPELAKEIL